MNKKQRTKLESEHDLLVIMLYEWENDGAYTLAGLCAWIWELWYPTLKYATPRHVPLQKYFPSLIKYRQGNLWWWKSSESRISAMKKAINDIQKQLYEPGK